jgi:TatD DNase family protein
LRLFDSHLHLTDDAFVHDLDDVLSRAAAAGVRELVTVASDIDDSGQALELARSRSGLWCSAGLHPHQASEMSPAAIREIERLAGEPEVVAIGETGLDFFYDHSERSAQRASFIAQLEVAERLELPVIVHSRDADSDMEAILADFDDRVTGVLHCFTGGETLLTTALDRGWYVSFSGIVTFKRYEDADLLRRVPDERLLIETDSPYLAPVPRRGRRNEPANLAHTCAAVAGMRGTSSVDIAAVTRSNAIEFYGLAEE